MNEFNTKSSVDVDLDVLKEDDKPGPDGSRTYAGCSAHRHSPLLFGIPLWAVADSCNLPSQQRTEAGMVRN
jgi:hypothetical protein